MINKYFNKDFTIGVKDSLPICVAFTFMCISFGGLSKVAGLSLLQTMGMAMLIYSIPLQMLLTQLFNGGLTLLTVAILTLIVNSRFFLMALSLVAYFREQPLKKIIPSFFMLSASSFTVAHVKITNAKFGNEQLTNYFKYYLGVASSTYVTTFFTTLIGFYIVAINNNLSLKHIFSIALGIHFTALTAMRWPNFKLILATLMGFAMTPVAAIFFSINMSIAVVPIFTGFIMLLFNGRLKK